MKKFGRKQCYIIILSGFFMCCSVFADTDFQSPVGLWKTIDDKTGEEKSIVKIWINGEKLFGRIDKLFSKPGEDPKRVCDKCKGDKKDQQIDGMEILWDLEKKDDLWTDGYILDPKNGKEYHCKIQLTEAGTKLLVRGYIGFSFIGRTQTWTRVK